MDGGGIDLRELNKVLAEETPAFDAYRRGDPDAMALWIAEMVRAGGRVTVSFGRRAGARALFDRAAKLLRDDHPNSLPE